MFFSAGSPLKEIMVARYFLVSFWLVAAVEDENSCEEREKCRYNRVPSSSSKITIIKSAGLLKNYFFLYKVVICKCIHFCVKKEAIFSLFSFSSFPSSFLNRIALFLLRFLSIYCAQVK